MIEKKRGDRMTYHILKDVGERGIPLSLDFGERGTALSFDLGERSYFFDAGERGQVLCTDPEWQMQEGPGWKSVKFDDGPGWAMKTTGPDWELSLDGGSGWQMYGPPEWNLDPVLCGPIETGKVVLH
ncbi:hypothetical protein ACSNN5_29575 [Brevibacillus formosus]